MPYTKSIPAALCAGVVAYAAMYALEWTNRLFGDNGVDNGVNNGMYDDDGGGVNSDVHSSSSSSSRPEFEYVGHPSLSSGTAGAAHQEPASPLYVATDRSPLLGGNNGNGIDNGRSAIDSAISAEGSLVQMDPH
jgi:hypothetical protein